VCLGPARLVVADPVTELAVFLAGAGQHGDKAAAVAGDVVHGRPVGELAVRDIEEVGAPDQGPELIPGRDVGAVIVGVCVLGPQGDRDSPVGGDGRHAEQLFQVGAVVLVVAMGDGRRRLPSSAVTGGTRVPAGEGDGGRVVVQLGELYRQWIANRRQLEQIVAEMETLSAAAGEILLRQAATPAPPRRSRP